MRESQQLKKGSQNLRKTYLNKNNIIASVNLIQVCFQAAPVNLLMLEIFLDFDWLGWPG